MMLIQKTTLTTLLVLAIITSSFLVKSISLYDQEEIDSQEDFDKLFHVKIEVNFLDNNKKIGEYKPETISNVEQAIMLSSNGAHDNDKFRVYGAKLTKVEEKDTDKTKCDATFANDEGNNDNNNNNLRYYAPCRKCSANIDADYRCSLCRRRSETLEVAKSIIEASSGDKSNEHKKWETNLCQLLAQVGFEKAQKCDIIVYGPGGQTNPDLYSEMVGSMVDEVTAHASQTALDGTLDE
jgi:hypothetical protein